ncbi:MAG: HesA/MoeB/ThiF family protein [Pseudodonghicola sp.]|nr:HesA/MoeB/ThiF family protein [Pseudodonghicola sp.]
MSRYARQIALPEVGEDGQSRLRTARVLVAGAGGLGVPVLQYLVGAGVGKITLIDGDLVGESNLHRQPLYRMQDIARPKAEAAAEALAALNPDVVVQPLVDWLTPANAPALAAQADVVLDCADTFAVSFTLSDVAHASGTPFISASAQGLRGYVGGFCHSAPSLRAVFPDLPHAAPTCETAGVLGPVVAAIGAIQAQMALAVLLDLAPSPLGRMMVLGAANWRTSDFRFEGAPEPDRPAPFIAADQITPDDMVIDLRSERPAPFRAGALHLATDALPDLALPDLGTRIVLACQTGLRAHNAGTTLRHRWAGDIALLALPGT